MNYKQTCDWMFKQLPMYQRQGKAAYKADLSNTILLMNHLGNPERKFRSVHVAGTNGKGSTSHMIASVLISAGYRVGLYTSPHLIDFRERIKINGDWISEEFVVDFIAENKSFFEVNHLSFFEMTVGMAFQYFEQEKVDIAIIEVGLGGRLDSTNVIRPELSVITNIGLDHTQFLGPDIKSIAAEKGGIIKENTPLIIGEYQEESYPVFTKLAETRGAPIFKAFENVTKVNDLDLKGDYQILNARTAECVLHQLKEGNTASKEAYDLIDAAHISKGLQNVQKNTGLQGRWQVLNQEPFVVCDTAHNREGLSYTMRQLKSIKYDKLHIVVGMVEDKNIEDLMDLFPDQAVYYFCEPKIGRALSVEDLYHHFKRHNKNGEVYDSVKQAYEVALSFAGREDLIYIGGSTFVVAEIL